MFAVAGNLLIMSTYSSLCFYRLTGFQVPPPVTSTGNVFSLRLTSDFAVSAHGFKLNYEGQKMSACICVSMWNCVGYALYLDLCCAEEILKMWIATSMDICEMSDEWIIIHSSHRTVALSRVRKNATKCRNNWAGGLCAVYIKRTLFISTSHFNTGGYTLYKHRQSVVISYVTEHPSQDQI